MEIRSYTLREMASRVVPPAVIENFIQSGFVVLASPEGVGKSFLAMHVAAYVASATVDSELKWNGRWVNKGSVLYCALEGTGGITNRMLTALFELNGIDGGDGTGDWEFGRGPDRVPLEIMDTPINLCNEKDAQAVIDVALRMRARNDKALPVRLVIVDTLSRFLGGDENKQQDMAAFVKGCDIIRKGLEECTVMVLHHFNKADGVRGSSVLTGAADQILWTDAEKGDLTKGTFMWTTEGKNGKWKEGSIITQHFKAVLKPIRDIDGHMVETFRDDGTSYVETTIVFEPTVPEAKQALTGFKRELWDVLDNTKSGLALTGVAMHVKRDASNVLKVLRGLEKDGWVEQSESKLWSVRTPKSPEANPFAND